jgi:glycosyltransferase involved in cell wall biosynthesis
MKSPATKQVLFVSPLPPPAGGIASWMEKILRHGLPGNYRPRLVNTRILGSRPVFGDATLGAMEAYRTISIIARLMVSLFTSRFEVAHINSSLSPNGIFRELICAVLVRLRGIPLVAHYHGNMAAFPQERLGGMSFAALRILIRLSAVNLVLNQPSRALCQQLVKGQNPKRCLLIPNFIEDAIFARRLTISRPGCARVRAVFVGGLTRAKGAIDFVELAQRLPDIDFHLIGHMLPDFASAMSSLPANVSIVGSLPYNDVIAHVASCDLFVFPSYTEGFPLAVLEAMSLGLPVVASNVGAIPEMIEQGKGGFLARPGDIEHFASSIAMLAQNPALREQQSQFNRKKSRENYSYSVVTRQLTAVYAQAVRMQQ